MNEHITSMTRRSFVAKGAGATAALASVRPLFAEAAQAGGLRAGVAETKATPAAEGTFLIGPMKPSAGVSDDLWVRALLLDDGQNRAAVVTLDYLGFDFDYTDRLIRSAAEAGGVPAEHVLVNSSHTHSTPLTAPWGPWKQHRDAPFFEMLPKKVAQVVKAASESLRSASLRYTQAPVQIGFNRRLLHNGRITMAPNPNGAVVPWVDVLRVDLADGKPLAVLFSHAAHPVIVHGASTLISGDYPGFAVSHVRGRIKGAVSLFAQGCCGNVNGFPLRGGIDAAKAAGRDLGDAVLRAMDAPSSAIVSATIRVRSLELQLPLADPPPLADLRRLHDQEKRPERKQRFAELIAIAEQPNRPTMRFPMRAVSVGNRLCMIGLPHEPFAEYHHHVVRTSPFKHNMVFAYTNGLECYVGTKKAYLLGDRGGYETSPRGAAFMFKSRLPLVPSAEAAIHQGMGRLLTALHADK